MKKDAKIYVSGHTGLLGSALVRVLTEAGFTNLLLRTHSELDLRENSRVHEFLQKERPEFVFHCAARVGNLAANVARPAEFFYDNMSMQMNVIDGAYRNGVTKLIFFSSNCAYPRLCPQPMKEEMVLSGLIEPTNEAYGVAKIAGLTMCKAYHKECHADFLTLIPASLYGPYDHFDKERSHIVPLLIKEIHDAKARAQSSVLIKSHPGKIREFIYVDDAARAAVWAMEHDVAPRVINVGTGEGVQMELLGELVKGIVGFSGEVIWDTEQPEGMPQKVLDPSLIRGLGFRHTTSLEEGLARTYGWFLKNQSLA